MNRYGVWGKGCRLGIWRGHQEVVMVLLSLIPLLFHSPGQVYLSLLGLLPLTHPPRSQDLSYINSLGPKHIL